MARPCFCDRLPPAGEDYSTAYCKLCWQWHNSPGHRAYWQDSPRCPHLWKRARDEKGLVLTRKCEPG